MLKMQIIYNGEEKNNSFVDSLKHYGCVLLYLHI
jgi:hypothetical protein